MWLVVAVSRECFGSLPRYQGYRARGSCRVLDSCRTFDARGICKHTLHCCVCDLCVGKIENDRVIEHYPKSTVSVAKINEDGTHGPFEVIGEGTVTVTYADLDDQGNSDTAAAEEIADFNKKIVEDFMAETADSPAAKSVWTGTWSDPEKGYYKCPLCDVVEYDPMPGVCTENSRLGDPAPPHHWIRLEDPPELASDGSILYNCTNCDDVTTEINSAEICPVADQNGPHNWVPIQTSYDPDLPF